MFDRYDQECGIPVRHWISTLFCMLGGRTFFQLLKVAVVKHFYEHRGIFDILRLTFIDGVIIGWLVYGNALFNSKDNDCSEKEGTAFLNTFM